MDRGNDVWAVLATGPSMSQAIADQTYGRCCVVAVSDSWRLAPWADALVSTDAAWWKSHPDAVAKFAGKRFGLMPSFRPVTGVERLTIATTHTNSGLFGAMVAVLLGAKRVLLCGVDLNCPGEHFFGRHPAPLKPTTAARMEEFKRQFIRYQPRGVEIINCSPSSALECYPKGELSSWLKSSS